MAELFSESLRMNAVDIIARSRKRGVRMATAESCTGGLIASLLTAISGSSDIFDRGFVTYSNVSKTDMLGVGEDLIAEHGAVSEQVAVAMAQGACARAKADLAVSVTGVAGPAGGSDEKPVGTVCIATASANDVNVQTFHFSGDRNAVRLQSVEAALAMLTAAINRSFSSFA